MISAWWMLLIPISGCFGFLLACACVAAREDRANDSRRSNQGN